MSISVVAEPKNMNEISFRQRELELKAQELAEAEAVKQARKSPFTRFYQINKEHSEDLMWLVSANANAYRILLFLLDHMDKYNAVMCSYVVLQEALSMSRTTASRAIKLLKNHGFIAVLKSGTSNVYVVNNDLAWSSWGNNVKYCEFPANIIIAASEQEDRINVKNKQITTVQSSRNEA